MACCSYGGVYIFGVVQLLIISACIFCYPAATVQTFVYTPRVVNGTLAHEHGRQHLFLFGLDFPCVLVSLLVASFVSNTFGLFEAGTLQSHNSYTPDSLQQVGLWDPLFWVITGLTHFTAVVAACSPVDVFSLLFSAFLLTDSLRELCAPIDPERGPTLVNFGLVRYMFGLIIAVVCVPAGCSARYAILLVMAVLDYFLGVGHTWDRAPTLETIANCRLFWASGTALCFAALYGAWNDALLMPVVSGTDE